MSSFLNVDRVMALRAQILAHNTALRKAGATPVPVGALIDRPLQGSGDMPTPVEAEQTALPIRNKLLSAYKDILAMPV